MARLYGVLVNGADLEMDDYWLVDVLTGVGDADTIGVSGRLKLPRGHVTRRQKELGAYDAYYVPLWLCAMLASRAGGID